MHDHMGMVVPVTFMNCTATVAPGTQAAGFPGAYAHSKMNERVAFQFSSSRLLLLQRQSVRI